MYGINPLLLILVISMNILYSIIIGTTLHLSVFLYFSKSFDAVLLALDSI